MGEINTATRTKIYNARFAVKGFSILANTSFDELTDSVVPALINPFMINPFRCLGSYSFQLSNVHARVLNQTFSRAL